MKTAIGTMSKSAVPSVAAVWKMKEPTPTTAVIAISVATGQSRAPARRYCHNATAAAITNATLLRALTGSDQNEGSVRSQ